MKKYLKKKYKKDDDAIYNYQNKEIKRLKKKSKNIKN